MGMMRRLLQLCSICLLLWRASPAMQSRAGQRLRSSIPACMRIPFTSHVCCTGVNVPAKRERGAATSPLQTDSLTQHTTFFFFSHTQALDSRLDRGWPPQGHKHGQQAAKRLREARGKWWHGLVGRRGMNACIMITRRQIPPRPLYSRASRPRYPPTPHIPSTGTFTGCV